MPGDQGLDALLRALGEHHPRRNLAELGEVTVSTGCFEREEAAVAHLTALRPALERAAATGNTDALHQAVLELAEGGRGGEPPAVRTGANNLIAAPCTAD
ncbi:hypothetical protein [Streptomyces sp. NPDC058683]|uniref:hypothetical protein n=1 Tax=Streptomyces sp. NPDC058683 TaxID=3346597 RepID=UPI0036672856